MIFAHTLIHGDGKSHEETNDNDDDADDNEGYATVNVNANANANGSDKKDEKQPSEQPSMQNLFAQAAAQVDKLWNVQFYYDGHRQQTKNESIQQGNF